MTLPSFEHSAADDLPSALAAVADGAVPYCGGTELLLAMSMGLLQPERIVSLRRADELRGIRVDADTLSLGATTTHREVSRSRQVGDAAPLLAQVAQRVGNSRVRATGTVGGNLAFAEPRSDLSTALIALGARVVLADATGGRSMALADFLRGPYETGLRPGELLTRIEAPAGLTDVGIYRKMTITERPVVGVAVVRMRQTGAWRVVVGAVGGEPFLAEANHLDDIDPAGVAAEVDVMPDLSGSEAYKRKLTEVVVRRCAEAARAQSEGGPV